MVADGLSLNQFANVGTILGTSILLTSWIIEKYQTDHWTRKMAEVDAARALMYQEMTLAETDAIFLASAFRFPSSLFYQESFCVVGARADGLLFHMVGSFPRLLVSLVVLGINV